MNHWSVCFYFVSAFSSKWKIFFLSKRSIYVIFLAKKKENLINSCEKWITYIFFFVSQSLSPHFVILSDGFEIFKSLLFWAMGAGGSDRLSVFCLFVLEISLFFFIFFNFLFDWFRLFLLFSVDFFVDSFATSRSGVERSWVPCFATWFALYSFLCNGEIKEFIFCRARHFSGERIGSNVPWQADSKFYESRSRWTSWFE